MLTQAFSSPCRAHSLSRPSACPAESVVALQAVPVDAQSASDVPLRHVSAPRFPASPLSRARQRRQNRRSRDRFGSTRPRAIPPGSLTFLVHRIVAAG
jgi:hypothetical protein